jgi:uncharacterized membrane protein YeaQ/YmgE (transglycosylase-associated protein family)
MGFFASLILGLLAGFIASKLVNKQGSGILIDIILGALGSIVGGWLFGMFGASGVTGLNIYSLLVSVVGAVILLTLYHAVKK